MRHTAAKGAWVYEDPKAIAKMTEMHAEIMKSNAAIFGEVRRTAEVGKKISDARLLR